MVVSLRKEVRELWEEVAWLRSIYKHEDFNDMTHKETSRILEESQPNKTSGDTEKLPAQEGGN